MSALPHIWPKVKISVLAPDTALVRCTDHPEWESDITGLNIIQLLDIVTKHRREWHGKREQ